MTLILAQRYAAKLFTWLQPNTERVMIAGSIRRERPEPADIDLCVIPKLTIYRDMFGAETGRQNHCWMFLQNYVANFNPATLNRGQQLPQVLTGGDRAGHRMTVQLRTVQLDLWFADAESWASKLINSTGSKDHNVWLSERAADRGLHWFVSYGLAELDKVRPQAHNEGRRARDAGLILPAKDETEFYARLGLAYIRPQDRELPWLIKNIDSGL